MKKDTEKTKVVFKKFDDGDIIALFPEEVEAVNNQEVVFIQSYMHIGQHSGASQDLLTMPDATKEESKNLKTELENHFGYNLEILN